MSSLGQSERVTQERIIALFQDLGYEFLGDWSDRADNMNIEESLLRPWLAARGVKPALISAALHRLRTAADNPNRSLVANNEEVYHLLRYGAQVKVEAGENTETVHFINWEKPLTNDFALAEEVTLMGKQERRPDLVLFVNGIAIGIIELKSSRVSLRDGIRQSLSNQQPDFNAWFFSTVQFIFAGNDSEGLKYGSIGTPEKMFLTWKEDEEDDAGFKLDKYLSKMCAKERLIELMHDFVLFDAGTKKLPRVHQYLGIKKAQKQVCQKKGGIIWHTQGSGKSIVMVLLAQWILENLPAARIAIVTDRDELDKQMIRVLRDSRLISQADVDHKVRATSGRDLMAKLGQPAPRLLCSLVQKFGKRGVDDFEGYIKELQSQPSVTVGDVFVFVDECHRTQSGKLHRAMKAMMPNAVFIGFTGTPLLKQDRETSLETFGGYIHTYKFGEAVEDKVVLDLMYEARDIDERLGSQEKIDAWFDSATQGLNTWQRNSLKEQWSSMRALLSAKPRMNRVVADIIFDFSVKPRLKSERGNAILVASSIYEACKYFELFQQSRLKNRCAVVTSYDPQAKDVTKEEVGANTETDKQFVYNTYKELLKDVEPLPGMGKTETYEEKAKRAFTKEPANMKLLVVVDKLLTGFDAPHCTYLYIDKSMQDHGLFQAICRTNRLDGEDKDFGYIVDYKDLFKKVENAISVYTSELDHSAPGTDPEVLLKDRLTKGSERLDLALEALALICEPVTPPQETLQFIHHFCGNTEVPTDLQEREPLREALYKGVAGLMRAFGNIADELDSVGYTREGITRIKDQIKHYADLREIIRKASNETLDLKAYEADMRHLLDTYIEADEPRKISPFDNMGLLELITKTGIAKAINALPKGLRGDKNAVAEVIENNVRRKVMEKEFSDPVFFAAMSELLKEVIQFRKARADEYEAYLKKIVELVKQVEAGLAEDTPEALKKSAGLRALYNLFKSLGGAVLDKAAGPTTTDTVVEVTTLKLARAVDEAVRTAAPDAWRGHHAREMAVKRAIFEHVQDLAQVEQIFLIVKAQAEY